MLLIIYSGSVYIEPMKFDFYRLPLFYKMFISKFNVLQDVEEKQYLSINKSALMAQSPVTYYQSLLEVSAGYSEREDILLLSLIHI